MPSDQLWMRAQPESGAVSEFPELTKRINTKVVQQTPMTLRQKSVLPRVEAEGGSAVIYTERSLWNGAVMLPGGHGAFCKGWKAMLGKLCLSTDLPSSCTRWSGEVLPSTSPCSLEREREGEMGEGKEEERCGLWVNKSLLKNLESNIVLSSACSKNYVIYF